MSPREPIFNVPGPILALLAGLLGVHLVRLALPPHLDDWLVLALAFIPGRYTADGAALPGGELARVTSFVSHALLHGNALHLAFNSIWLTIFGSLIVRRIGAARLIAFSAASAAAGALTFLALNPGLFVPVIGASGAVSGLMGAAMRLLISALNSGDAYALRQDPERIRLEPLREGLRDRRLLLATAIWILLNVIAALGLGQEATGGAVAWEAHVGGYLFGLLAFGLFDVQMRKENA